MYNYYNTSRFIPQGGNGKPDPWREYEKRKAALFWLGLPPLEYEAELARIAREVGV